MTEKKSKISFLRDWRILPFLAALFLFGWFLESVSSILWPFLSGIVIAYFLNPLVDKLDQTRLPRSVISIGVLLIFFMIFLGLILLIVPFLVTEFIHLARVLHDAFNSWVPYLERMLNDYAPELIEGSKKIPIDFGTTAVSYITKGLTEILNRAFALINIISLLLIAPLVAFYMLRDWPSFVEEVLSWIPKSYLGEVKGLLSEADSILAGFVRGQMMVCLSLSVIYSISWGLVGVNYALILGILTGFLTIIPYLGQFIGTSMAILVALSQGGGMQMIALVIMVQAITTTVEGMVLTPVLVGDHVRLHPVWVIFALVAGAKLMGLTGVLIAVPCAAVLGVFSRYAIKRYQQSRYAQ